MSLKRTRGAVYDPKYRRMVLGDREAHRLKVIFQEIGEWYGVEIDTQKEVGRSCPYISFGPTEL